MAGQCPWVLVWRGALSTGTAWAGLCFIHDHPILSSRKYKKGLAWQQQHAHTQHRLWPSSGLGLYQRNSALRNRAATPRVVALPSDCAGARHQRGMSSSRIMRLTIRRRRRRRSMQRRRVGCQQGECGRIERGPRNERRDTSRRGRLLSLLFRNEEERRAEQCAGRSSRAPRRRERRASCAVVRLAAPAERRRHAHVPRGKKE